MPPDSIKAADGVKVVGYLPSLYKHLGAADLCIVSGGGTITLELAALQSPSCIFRWNIILNRKLPSQQMPAA